MRKHLTGIFWRRVWKVTYIISISLCFLLRFYENLSCFLCGCFFWVVVPFYKIKSKNNNDQKMVWLKKLCYSKAIYKNHGESDLYLTWLNFLRLHYKAQESKVTAVSYTHLRAHETKANLVCRLLLEKKN